MSIEPPLKIDGLVTRFKGNGRKLGYPTANLTSQTDLADGVYFGHADLGKFKNHPAVIFIGTPTTMGDTERRVEAHLLDLEDEDHYDEELSLSVEYYHRANKTFDGIDQLLEIMHSDEQAAREWFASASSGSGRT